MPSKMIVHETKNYSLFVSDADNRPVDLSGRRVLRDSMKEYGFIRSYHIICYKGPNGKLIVKDGQNRLAMAETLGLPVFYTIESQDFDVAKANISTRIWTPRDYMLRYANAGNKHYIECLAFSDEFNLHPMRAALLLSGYSGHGGGGLKHRFSIGAFVVQDRDWARMVANTYGAIASLSRSVRSSRFLEACIAACRVDGFDPARLITNSKRCREKLVAYATRDAYLDMIEDIYNFRKKQLVPVRVPAQQAMKARSLIQEP